jgi:uncharacterized protein (DUF608 family)
MESRKISRRSFMQQSVLASVAIPVAGSVCLAGCTDNESTSSKKRPFNAKYENDYLNRIAFPIGGMGAGMFCIEGSGAISHMSVRHNPDLFNEPTMYAAIHIKGVENGTKVIEGQSPEWKRFGQRNSGGGMGDASWGLPRFEKASFDARFPFAEIDLQDANLPVAVTLKAWSPFIPTDADNSSLPVGAIEYTFRNTGAKTIEAIFSYTSRNFMTARGGGGNAGGGTSQAPRGFATINPVTNGFILSQTASETAPATQGDFAIFTDNPQTVVDHCLFRGGWFDAMTINWNDLCAGIMNTNAPIESNSPGASLSVPFTLNPGEKKTIHLYMAWYVPRSTLRNGGDANTEEDKPNVVNCCDGLDSACCDPGEGFYRPWYSSKFENIKDVAAYWLKNYSDLKAKSQTFTDAFYASTLPDEVKEAIAANLTIIKSSTVLRQYDGRLWGWEGCNDNSGCCSGSCTHVWNYAQAIPHLFPAMERSLRETEFMVSQNKAGHQTFRAALPIRPVEHGFHPAADGQLGGIMKAYREWRISGNTEWLKKMYPNIRQSLDYCISIWDPREVGALEEPHHNTYDIEFWGPDCMCTSFYAGALQAITLMGKAVGEDVERYEMLLAKSKAYMEDKLYDGEYFIQDIRWKGLNAPDPTQLESWTVNYSDEAKELLTKEGPKYQYGTGCLSDGVLGSWMSLVCGMPEVVDKEKIKSHLVSIHKYNLKDNLVKHANPQRPTYAMGDDGGLLLCSWPKGGKLQLPFVYSDEVWTGIEYQVASHLMFAGEVQKGLDIVKTARARYDGRVRNPFNEYECGSWYARAMSSYGMIEGLTGIRFDAVDGTLYIDSRIGNHFTSFLSTNTGFGNVGLKNGKPFVDVKMGVINVKKCIVSGNETVLA